MRAILCLAFILFAVSATPAFAESAAQKFVGIWSGQTISTTAEGLEQRDLAVTVTAKDKSFVVKWTTIIRKDGKTDRREFQVEFQATPREGVYSAAMRTNMFGAREPLDPLKGDPYVWARIKGDTLTVHALHILDDGGYEMQVYDRTVTGDTMALKFSRVRDGQQLVGITGSLKKSK